MKQILDFTFNILYEINMCCKIVETIDIYTQIAYNFTFNYDNLKLIGLRTEKSINDIINIYRGANG